MQEKLLRSIEKKILYEEDKFFPNNIVELQGVGIIRYHRPALLIIYPVLYNPVPSYINVIKNGTSYAMTKQDNLDCDYIDGCIYEYSTYLPSAQYNYFYYFNSSVGKYSYTTNIYNDLRVHSKPTLTNESISPKIGYWDTLITFKINYNEFDNETPLQVYVIINDILYTMSKLDTSDNNYTDGCTYILSIYLSLNSINYT